VAVYALLLLTWVRLWLMPLGSSLWLDETGTYYLATLGWDDYIAGRLPQIQTPLYTAFMHVFATLTGPNEVLLRLPSVLAMTLAAVLLYRIALRFADEEAGLISVAVFVVIPFNVFAAADARPYGLAMFAAVGAMLMLLRWLDDGQFSNGMLYILLAGLTVHLHYAFATTLLIHGAYVAMTFRRNKISVLGAALAAASIGLLLLPLAPAIGSLMVSAGVHTFAGPPQLNDFFASFVPVNVVSSLWLGVLAAALFANARIRLETVRGSFSGLALCWIVIPPASLFLFSWLSGANVFVSRYYLPAFAGVSMLLGVTVRAIRPVRARQAAVALLLVVGMTSKGIMVLWPTHGFEDWRGAVQAVRLLAGNEAIPVLFETGFVEASRQEWLTRDEYRKVLLAPLMVYPLETQVVTLPAGLDEASVKYIDAAVNDVVIPNRRVILLGHARGNSLVSWLRGRLWSLGYSGQSVGRFGNVVVILFERRPELESRAPRTYGTLQDQPATF